MELDMEYIDSSLPMAGFKYFSGDDTGGIAGKWGGVVIQCDF
jgi:hypothetical protein